MDRKDQANHTTTIEAAKKNEDKEAEEQAARDYAAAHPTAAAKAHGNEPSRGAKVDEKIVDEEAEIIRKMDEAKAQSAEAKKH